MRVPSLKIVIAHFKNAKEINCLQMGINVSVAYVTNYQYHEDQKTYTVFGGVVTVWNDQLGFAPIVKTKCEFVGCEDCKECKDKAV